ncbi:MAG: purine/pyrimidine permease [Candidatus Pristimantibacillus lignocellulolyticus]|uniref:Purine/pyrimidine permease n=1 Tax=Candidatus Pristimantibacillus lignocellulolyticus TaxID=2994561 RepID=A0A9J6ZJX9_9BACL|nr:MAG: purine/pyrimidine permease [Candidatus Pristimantibacillus lignocellulolyticus]
MKVILSGLQWMIFMIAGAIAAPIAIADLYNLTPIETSELIQSTIIVLGIAGFLQGLLGHKFPIHEGPAGLWWSIFTIYASLVGVLYSSNIAALQALSGGMIISGGLFVLISVFKLMDKIARLFTPTITFIYLFLLIFQLSGSFMKGMMGITSSHTLLDVNVLLLSVIVICITFWLGNCRLALLRQFSVIVSILIGWLLFMICGKVPVIVQADALIKLPNIFPFGWPQFDGGTMTTAFLLTLLLITNAIASIRLMETVMKHKPMDHNRYLRAGFVSGITHIISGCLGAIGSVPISGAAGYVEQTGTRERRSFLIGCSLVVFISLFPPIMNVISAIPAPIGYAVTFVIFVKMVGLALMELKKVFHEKRTFIISGVSLIFGVGLMFVPSSATSHMSPVLIAILNNGLISGSLLAIILEQGWIWKDRFNAKNSKKINP